MCDHIALLPYSALSSCCAFSRPITHFIMSVALYRKYRPKTFSEVSGQNHIKVTLQNEIAAQKVAHAYLFCGPRGTGKTTLARLLAKSVNCLQIKLNGEPCNVCASCEEIAAGRAMDIIEIDAASHTGVDNVRDNIIQNARFTPTKNKFKVFIIDEAHMLSTAAFNALLKILEEPPSYVIFILATTEAHKLPKTIISRCQRFDFKKINAEELIARLKWIAGQEGISVEESVLAAVTKQSGGCVRDAESLLEQIFALGEKSITAEQAELVLPRAEFNLLYQFLDLIIKKKTVEVMDFINNLMRDGFDPALFGDHFVEFVRKVLVYKIDGNLDELARDIDDAVAKNLVNLTRELEAERLLAIIKKFIECKELFKQSPIIQLPLEVAALELSGVGNWQGSVSSAPILPKVDPASSVSKIEPAPVVLSAPKQTAQPNPFATAPTVLAEQKPNAQPNPFAPSQVEATVVVPPAPVAPTVDVKPTETVTEAMAVNIDFSVVQGGWDKVINFAKDKNYALYMSLRMSRPVAIEGRMLYVGFPYEIQRQKAEGHENRRIMLDAVSAAYGVALDLKTRVVPDLSVDTPAGGNGEDSMKFLNVNELAKSVAADFDGQVVE